MMKHTMISVLILMMVLMSVCPAAGETIAIDKAILEKILQRQDELKQEIRQLKEQLKEKDEAKTPPAETPLAEDIEYLKEDVEDMSDRLDAVEKKSILDKIQLDGEFRTEVHYYNYENMQEEGEPRRDGSTDELWSGRLRLNLRSEITRDIIFQGRLSYYKFWGDTNYEGNTSGDFFYASSPEQDGNLHVERAYFDYFVPETPLSVTIGRMPTANGPPYEFRNNTTRKATWPMLCHDGELDGIMTNLSLDKWTGLDTSFFRLGYYKFSQNYKQYQGVEIDPTRVAIAAFETEIPGINNSILWVSYDRAFDFAPFEHELESYHPPDSGYMDKFNIHLQFDNIMNSGFSCFGSFAWENIHPRSEGTIIPKEVIPDYPFPFDYEIGLLGDNIPDVTTGEISLGKRRDGYAYYAGVNYTFPFEKLNYPQLRFEYNHGSKYWIAAPVGGGDEFFNKLNVNGDVYEIYYIQPIDVKHMFCRIGFIRADYHYLSDLIGPPRETNLTQTDTYFVITVRF